MKTEDEILKIYKRAKKRYKKGESFYPVLHDINFKEVKDILSDEGFEELLQIKRAVTSAWEEVKGEKSPLS